MPNRIIKETICTSDNLNSLSPEEEIFFYRLIVNCDDYGVADGRTAIVRAKCFPLRLDMYSEYQIEEWLEKLQSADLIFMYEVDSRRYLKMKSWEKHQQIRAKKSKFPLPDSEGAKPISFDINGNLISNDINGNQIQADDDKCPRNPIQSESNPNPNPNPTPAVAADENPNPNPTPVMAVDENVQMVYQFFKECKMGEVNGVIAETIIEIVDKYPMELIKEAFRLAGLQNARTIKYPNKILENWMAKGITTLDGAQKEQSDPVKQGLNKKMDFQKFPHHEYKESELEGLFEDVGGVK